jgi:hypothetical protein
MTIQKIADRALALGNAAEHHGAMANRFVARDAALAGEGLAARDGYVGHNGLIRNN